MGADDKPEKREKASKHSAEKHKDRSKDKDRGQKEHKSSKEHKEHKHKRRAEDEPRRDDARASDKRQKLPDEPPEAGAGRSGGAHATERQANGAGAAPSAPKPDAGLEPEAGPAPGALKAQVQDAGGELSMSVEETNRVRISLGLKPLVIGDGGAAKAEAENRAAERAEEARRAQAEELAERVKAQREKRQEQAKLRAVKTLGEAAADVDDLGAWVTKSRALEEARKAEERAKADKAARMLALQDEEAGASDEDDEDPAAGGAALSAAELAGMRVRHSAEELGEGETMVMTLADRPIMDARGELAEDADELENALVMEQKTRDRAKRAATKGTNEPLFAEDGRVRSLLEKYDEEDAGGGMRVAADGALEADTARRQEDIRRRLAAGAPHEAWHPYLPWII